MSRIKRPLNKKAVKAANEEIYAAHAGDPRPNALYDEAGNRKKLDATDPAQSSLRKEWVASYKKNDGKVEETKDKEDTAPDNPVRPCPKKTCPS